MVTHIINKAKLRTFLLSRLQQALDNKKGNKTVQNIKI